MDKKTVEVLWAELADHFQVALTAIEAAYLTGTVRTLPQASAQIVIAWEVFQAAAGPVLGRSDGDGRGG